MAIKNRTPGYGPVSGYRATVTVTSGSLSASTITEVTAALTGLSTTDVVVVNAKAALSTNVGIVNARCNASGVLTVGFLNPTTQTIASFTPALQVHVAKYGA